jgi:hypothetical protein
MDDGNRTITISSTGNLDIDAAGVITVKGAMIKLN